MHKYLVGLFIVTISLHAHAQQPNPCASANNTIEINECAQNVLKIKDAELNKAYQALLKSLNSSMSGDTTDYAAVKRELSEAQRAWIKFRDSDCNAKYKFWEQGSIRGTVFLACLAACRT